MPLCVYDVKAREGVGGPGGQVRVSGVDRTMKSLLASTECLQQQRLWNMKSTRGDQEKTFSHFHAEDFLEYVVLVTLHG